MKKKLNQLGQKVLSKLLVLLGFSCTFVFMACYGPRPQAYEAVEADDLVDTTMVDSLETDSTSEAVTAE